MKKISLLMLSLFILSGFLIAYREQFSTQTRPLYAPNLVKIKLTIEANNLSKLPQGYRAESESFRIDALDQIFRIYKGKRIIRAHRRVNDRNWERSTGFDRWFILEFEGRPDINSVLTSFRANRYIEEACPEYIAYPTAVPNDTYYSYNWGHNNTAQLPVYISGSGHTGSGVGTVGFDSDAQLAWDQSQGYGSASITIAIIDSGADTSHPDLRLVAGYDYGDNDSNPMDDSADPGHGTACSGIAAAIANNGTGVVGIAGGCSVMPLKVANSAGTMYFTAIENALTHAADNGAHVISLSLGATGIEEGDIPSTDAALTYAYNSGLAIFAATANGNTSTIDYPSNHTVVISVGAASPCGQRKSTSSCDGENWWGSNYGSTTQDAKEAVDIMGPTILPTTDLVGTYGYNTSSSPAGDYYMWFNGTSCATPYVAGVAALLLSRDPTLTPAEVRSLITSTATDMTYDGGTGWDRYTGYGLVNANNALTLLAGGIPNPVNFTATAVSPSQINLYWSKNSANDDVMVAWSPTETFGTPEYGTTYTVGNTIPGGGTVLYNGGDISAYAHTSLNENTTYYYKAWSLGDDGSKVLAYSTGVTAQATTLVNQSGTITIFEEDWDGDLADWYVAQLNQTNRWVVANATYHSSPYCAYITNNTSTNVNQYSNTTSISHLFIDITFPTGTDFELSFTWKCSGQTYYDDLQVYLTDTSVTPVAGTLVSYLYRIGGPYNGQSAWQTPTIVLNNNVSGTTKRLVFSWRNNNTTRNNPPAAIDDIIILGTIADPELTLFETSFDYGLAYIGASNCTPHTFTVTNTGGGTITIYPGDVTLTGTVADQFTLIDDNLYPANINFGQTASWSVKFDPLSSATYGEKTAYLSINDNIARGGGVFVFDKSRHDLFGASLLQNEISSEWRTADIASVTRTSSTRLRAISNIFLRGFAVHGVSQDYTESYTDFSLDLTPWTQYDDDNSATYGIQDVSFTNSGYTGSFIAFNPDSTTPALTTETWQPYSGDKYFACFAATTPPNNDWLISPLLSFEEQPRISFFAKSITDAYGLERFKVLYSTTGNSHTDFTNYLAGSATTYVEAPTIWTKYEYAIPIERATSLYVAIQCVSNDAFAFMVDDFVAGEERKTYTLNVLSTGFEQPGTDINKDGNDTGFDTDHTYTASGLAGLNSLVGSYSLGPAPAGYHWQTTPITVAAGDFTLENGYTVTITFVLIDDTVPVELSSFTGIITPQNFIMLEWITQSETNVSGFYLFRNNADNLSDAERINAFIQATNTSQEASYIFVDSEAIPGYTYYYWLQHIDLSGEFEFHGPVSIHLSNTNTVMPAIPLVTSLQSIYPNPFNPTATISYGLSKAAGVELVILNLKGQMVRRLVSEAKNAGSYRVMWDGRNDNGVAAATGVYLVRMRAGSYKETRKLIMLK